MDWSKIEVILFYFLTLFRYMAQLTDHQMYTIQDKILEGYNDATIAHCIGKSRSTLSRLFKKYPRDTFDAEKVIQDRFHTKSVSTKQHARIHPWGVLAGYIDAKFHLDWSPDQIAESWKEKQKAEHWESVKLSKDTVYDWIYDQYDPKFLKRHLRRRNKEYRNRKQEAALWGKYQIAGRTLIDERAKEHPQCETREEIGHWEWDTIIGKDRSGAILTLVERKTKQTLIAELPLGKNALWVTTALTQLVAHIPKDKIKTITFDNGREFADHQMMRFELKTLYGMQVDIYFAHPYHSWERWTNENTNGLIRQYIPKKTDFKTITQKDLDKIQILLNSRPRKRLNYATPDQEFWGNEKCCVSE